MAKDKNDRELSAIQSILGALESLDKESQERAVDYVLQRLGIGDRKGIGSSQAGPEEGSISRPKLVPLEGVTSNVVDIRSLKNEKSPKTAIEMAILVAYYLTEYAPIEERKSSINTQDLIKYFKQANFRLPKYLKDTLPDAKTSGYVETVSKGEYRLTPVGYNLAVHGLPRDKKKT